MSGTFSKYFTLAFDNISCREVIHPNSTCLEWWREMLFHHAIIGAAKFYLPVCVISHLLNITKWNKSKTWKEFFEMVKGSLIFGYGFIGSIFVVLCAEYHLMGRRYNPRFFIALPVLCGTIFSVYLPRPILKTESVALFNMYLEFLIRKSPSELIQTIRKSKFSATLIFSFLNILIMCGMFKANCPNLWFSKFHCNKNTETDACKCIHSKLTCRNYLVKEISQTIKFGLGICIIKALLPRIGKLIRKPSEIPKVLLRKFDFSLLGFLVGMNGLFKVAFCSLNNFKLFSPRINCALASFLSGFSYFLSPRYEIFTLAITNAITMIYKNSVAELTEQKNQLSTVIKGIEKFPIYHLLLIFATPILVQLRISHPYFVNKIVSSFVTVGSNGKDNFIIERMIGVMMGFGLN